LWCIILSGALHNFNMYAIGAFLAPLLMRYYGQTVKEANNIMGVVYCVGGLGILLGGWACDWMVRRRISGRLEVSTLALAVGSPCVFMALQQSPGAVSAFTAWLLPGCLLFYVYYAAVYSTIQDIVEPALRGKAMALYFFAMYYLGGAGGPYIIGWLSDLRARVAAAERGSSIINSRDAALGLHDAMYVVPILGGLLVLVLLAASRTVARDYERLKRWLAGAHAADSAS
jgi:MFS family permease